jgi:hypothetical protein
VGLLALCLFQGTHDPLLLAEARALARRQGRIGDGLRRVERALAGTDFAVFARATEFLRQDVSRIAMRLQAGDVGNETLQLQSAVFERLKDIARALHEATPEGSRLTRAIAELRLIRTLQKAVRYGTERGPWTPETLARLRRDQRRVRDLMGIFVSSFEPGGARSARSPFRR